MCRIQILQVAVNDYAPQSKVSSLRGCIEDINAMLTYLESNFKHLFDPIFQPLQFINESATKENVVRGFQDLAKRTKSNDFVFIQFSGHGSQSISAIEFRDDKNTVKYDESFLLYDSRCLDGYDLSDKEIAQLLNLFHPGADIIFIADCCHAGTITKGKQSTDLLSRYQPARYEESRPLSTYWGYDPSKRPEIPESNHLAITACSGKENAYEEDKGVFTKILIEELTLSKAPISYTKLFERTRNRVNQVSTTQTPQFNISGNFNANRFFLSREEDTSTKFQVVRDWATEEWKMMAGEVHGLSEDMQLQVAIRNIDKQNFESLIAKIKTVRLAHCLIEGFDPDDFGLPYFATITNIIKPTIKFVLKGDDQLCTKFKDELKPFSPFYQIGFHLEDAPYEINISSYLNTTGCINFQGEIFLASSRKLVHLIKEEVDWYRFCNTLYTALQHIELWERLVKVKSDNPKLESKFDWKIEIKGTPNTASPIYVELETDIEKNLISKPFKIIISNKYTEPLHFTLLQFNRNYSIFVYRSDGSVKRGKTFIIRKDKFTIRGDSESSKLVFKLIVSKKALDQSYLEQKSGLNLGDWKGNANEGSNKKGNITIASDTEVWHAETKTIIITRKN